MAPSAQKDERENAMRNPRADEKLKSIREAVLPYELKRGGISLTILKNVYPTSELSELFIEVMDHPTLGVKKGDSILDYGTGTGFLGIQAAMRGANVIAIDVNEDAITCGIVNAQKVHVDACIDFRCGKNFTALKPHETFDMIFAGMPWDDAVPIDVLEMSVYDQDFTMRHALFENAHKMLRFGGRIIVSSSEGHMDKYPGLYGDLRFSHEIVAQRKIKDLLHYAVLNPE
jgi:methylase of polypeptide subunit release factors